MSYSLLLYIVFYIYCILSSRKIKTHESYEIISECMRIYMPYLLLADYHTGILWHCDILNYQEKKWLYKEITFSEKGRHLNSERKFIKFPWVVIKLKNKRGILWKYQVFPIVCYHVKKQKQETSLSHKKRINVRYIEYQCNFIISITSMILQIRNEEIVDRDHSIFCQFAKVVPRHQVVQVSTTRGTEFTTLRAFRTNHSRKRWGCRPRACRVLGRKMPFSC